MNEVALVPEPTALAPVDVPDSLPAVQPSAGVLLSEHKFHGCGIYGFENIETGMFYVGQTLDFWRRVREELNCLRVGEHHCKYLQRSFTKHGETKFRLHVLELCDSFRLNERELFWIHKKKETAGVYNAKISSDCGRFITVTNELKDIQSKNKKEFWALPLFAFSQQKKMWSDSRKALVRSEYLSRIVSEISATHKEVCDVYSLRRLLEDWISNGLSTGQILSKTGFYKRKLYMMYKALGIDREKLYLEWCGKVIKSKRNELRVLCDKHGASIAAAYVIRSRIKRKTLPDYSGRVVNLTSQLT